MLGLKQPVLGITAVTIGIAISFALISLFDAPTFTSWVAYLMICFIPTQIVTAIMWGTKQPQFAARRKQPVRGIIQVALTLAAGAIVAAVYLAIVGGNQTPPGPVPSHAIITSVIVTFWATIMWGGWPFKSLFKNEILAGFALLIACYVINLLLFRLLFDYSFIQGAPVYVASLDPHGMFNAIAALVFYVTFLSVMFLMLSFDLWPLTLFPAVMRQPILGIVWTMICLAGGGIVFWIGTQVMQIDLMVFMVTVPIPYIFGTIVVLNMLQNSLAARLTQPAKGLVNAALVAIIGTGLAQLYRAFAPIVSGTLASGSPAYELEIWLASALLAVTFPFLIFIAEFFKFWPLADRE